jgi:hypothetical protein
MNIDYKALVKLSPEEQTVIMKQFFNDIKKMTKKEQVENIHEMIGSLTEHATDREYINLTKVSLDVILAMDENEFKNMLTVRLDAQFELGDFFERTIDGKDFMIAVEEMPEKDRLLNHMKTLGYL